MQIKTKPDHGIESIHLAEAQARYDKVKDGRTWFERLDDWEWGIEQDYPLLWPALGLVAIVVASASLLYW